MNLLVTIRIALRALRKNKMRAGLTILGVVIGIAAVTAMVSIGQSASSLVQGQFESLGTNILVIFSASHRHGPVHHGQGSIRSLTAGDSEAIADECPAVLATSPIVGTGGQVIYGNTNWRPREMVGVGTDYLIVGNWTLRHGGFFTERDISSSSKVCVIGQTLVAKLFQTTNPLNETIRISNIPFRIIGILEPKGANIVGEDQDNIIMMPHTTVAKRLRRTSFDTVDVILVSARAVDRMPDAQREVRQLLCERHHVAPGQPADFEVQDMTEIADILGVITGTMTLLLSSIAGISLVVGGVGIMNIMLVSVTERTREIGIRMAVGARGGDILRQFLIESILLAMIGGLVGFGLGVAASAGITAVINSLMKSVEWPTVISIPAAVLAIVFSSAVGIAFGFYPAWRASKLDPIEALRYE
ncbi:MAG: ABC transporter permease [Pirellulales bacterium]|nr:ABC transporter permease [Pirellulales bacterium]